MDKRTHATINNQECHIGDFIVIYPGSGITQLFERIYRVTSVCYTAGGCWLTVWIDTFCSSHTKIRADQVTGVLLESEVVVGFGGRFKRAD